PELLDTLAAQEKERRKRNNRIRYGDVEVGGAAVPPIEKDGFCGPNFHQKKSFSFLFFPHFKRVQLLSHWPVKKKCENPLKSGAIPKNILIFVRFYIIVEKLLINGNCPL
ncbi:MAG: hypothetical protein IKD78_13840, partial [Bacteroidales bacterium]|nr:hypothetical protein [Bacteroidales bacterium]